MKFWALGLLCLLPVGAQAATVTASTLSDTCQHANRAINVKGKWDGKKPEDVYATGQCEGFLEGWIAGIDGAILNDKGTFYVVTVKHDQIANVWAIADALSKHLADKPLEGGKPADTVLQDILATNGLLNVQAVNPTAAPDQTLNPALYKQ